MLRAWLIWDSQQQYSKCQLTCSWTVLPDSFSDFMYLRFTVLLVTTTQYTALKSNNVIHWKIEYFRGKRCMVQKVTIILFQGSQDRFYILGGRDIYKTTVLNWKYTFWWSVKAMFFHPVFLGSTDKLLTFHTAEHRKMDWNKKIPDNNQSPRQQHRGELLYSHQMFSPWLSLSECGRAHSTLRKALTHQQLAYITNPKQKPCGT